MIRFRQTRVNQATRDQYADVDLSVDDLIMPYFVVEGSNVREAVPSMPGVSRFSIDTLVEDARELYSAGVSKVLLFGVVGDDAKDERGSSAYAPDNLVARTVKALKSALPGMTVITDICLCEYTSHGHCGLLRPNASEPGMLDVDNDSTLPLLAEMAYTHALAGADMVAPSAMMDGQVAAIRGRLDSTPATADCQVMGYSAKYASAFYGPFRDAAGSAPGTFAHSWPGYKLPANRKTYQMDYRTHDQGLDEIEADLKEGAAYVMVKPAMPYLDIMARAMEKFKLNTEENPVQMVAYQVSGEYAMLCAAAQNGWLDRDRVIYESLIGIKRAGASLIITYFAKEVAEKGLTMNGFLK